MRISDWSSDVCSSDLGTLSSLASELSQPELEAAAGNGGNEIRAWLMLAAAMNDAPGRTLAYSDMPEWLTGMAVAVIRSEEHTSELQSIMRISYAVFCLKKKNSTREEHKMIKYKSYYKR